MHGRQVLFAAVCSRSGRSWTGERGRTGRGNGETFWLSSYPDAIASPVKLNRNSTGSDTSRACRASINSAHDYKLQSAGNSDGIDITATGGMSERGYFLGRDVTRRDMTSSASADCLCGICGVARSSYPRTTRGINFNRAICTSPAFVISFLV